MGIMANDVRLAAEKLKIDQDKSIRSLVLISLPEVFMVTLEPVDRFPLNRFETDLIGERVPTPSYWIMSPYIHNRGYFRIWEFVKTKHL